jgi:hypothetical protein
MMIVPNSGASSSKHANRPMVGAPYKLSQCAARLAWTITPPFVESRSRSLFNDFVFRSPETHACRAC